jgi:hypothetical protein
MTRELDAIILTKNEARHIADCIASLQFADHVLVFDSFSSDDTIEIAAQAGAEVQQHTFTHYAQQRNDALRASQARWVLFVDADERIPPELAAEIQQTLQNPMHAGYWIPRHNYIFGKLTRHTGWYPDYQMRLLRRDAAHYDPNRKVHELVMLSEGEAGYLKTPLIHYNYESVTQFHETQRRYVAYDAQILFDEGIRPKVYTPYLQPFRHFKWRFVDLKGYRDGLHGLRLSVLMAWYEFRKYRLLKQMRKTKD